MNNVSILILMAALVSVATMYASYSKDPKATDTFEQSYIPIYIISLEQHRESRLEPLLKNIQTDGLLKRYGVESVHGVSGKEKVVEAFLSKGQIGCWLSHIHMWKQLVQSSHPLGMILEDDAEVHLPDMLPELYAILAELPVDWGICYLGGRYADDRDVQRISPHLVRSASSRIWHSHAYLVTRAAAQQLLEASQTWHSLKQADFEDVLPVDDWMTHPNRNIPTFKADPELVAFKVDDIHDTQL